MKNLRSAILVAFIGIAYIANGQTKLQRNYTLKLYINHYKTLEENWLSQSYPVDTFHTNVTSEIKFGRVTPAVTIETKNKNFHEFELVQLKYQKTKEVGKVVPVWGGYSETIGRESKEHSFQFRYEYNHGFQKNDGHKLHTYVGIATNPFFRHWDNVPMNSLSFPGSKISTGARFMIIPRITYQIKPKWYLDLNAILHQVQYEYVREKVDNPHFSSRQMTTAAHNLQVKAAINQVRLGVGVKL